MMQSFSKILRDKRRETNISQRKLAEKVGVDFSYISKLENGRLPPPSSETIKKISVAIGCKAEDLFAAARKMPEQLTNAIASQSAALRFLDEASRLKLSDSEWEEMTGKLKSLKSETC